MNTAKKDIESTPDVGAVGIESTALFASIAALWESRPECLERVTDQVRAIHDKLIEWGWETVDRDELDHATIQYSRACGVHECCEWLPFDVMPDWEDDLYCLLMDEDEDRWMACINENRPVWELAETLRREANVQALSHEGAARDSAGTTNIDAR